MKIKSILVAVGACVFGFMLGLGSHWLMEKNQMAQVHTLKAPLLLSGGGHLSVLPEGTTLYYDKAFPEGFVRYTVYVNVEGVSLPTAAADEQFPINPLTAFPMDQDQLRVMLRDYPITKDDLAAVLGRGVLSKEEIRQLLVEYSD